MFSIRSYMSVGNVWRDITSENFISMVEHGYDTACWFPHNPPSYDLMSESDLEYWEPYFCLAEEYGIKVMIASPQWIYDADPTHEGYTMVEHSGWTISDYEAAFGELLDALEVDSRIVGYFTEVPDYVGVQWLRGKTDKIMMYDYYGAGVETAGYHFSEIIEMHDEVVFETFEICGNLTNCINSIATIYAIKPTIKMGEWCQTLPLWPGDIALYWAPLMSPMTPPPPPYDGFQRGTGIYLTEHDGSPVPNQQDSAPYWIGLLQAQMLEHFGHKFDISIMQNFDCMQTFDKSLTFHDTLSIPYSPTGAIPKPVQQTNQNGHILAYSGAAICTYPATSPLVDTFDNTGNELLLIKNASNECTADTLIHDITVSGLDALEQDYRISVPFGRCVPIGPFPTALFGALPTITYDNSNLYISILKDVPYSEQS